MILDVRILLVPRGLIGDGCGIVTLCGALHRHPRQVLNAHRHAERRLPVAVELMTAEVKIPTRDAVKLTEHTGSAVLVNGGLALLGGGELKPRAKHIDAGNAEGTVRAHTVAERTGLGVERRLLHHMTRQGDAVLVAPLAASVGKGFCKARGNVIVIAVTRERRLAIGQIPKQLGQMLDKRFTVCRLVGLVQIVRPGELDVLTAFGKAERALAAELRLVGEDRRNGLAEFL